MIIPNFLRINQKEQRHHVLLHMICWLFFAVYEIAFVFYMTDIAGNLINYTIYYLINICQFYIQVALMNRLLFAPKPNWGLLLVWIALLLICSTIIKGLAGSALLPVNTPLTERIKQAQRFGPIDFFRSCYFGLLALFYWLGGNIAVFRKKAAEAETAQYIALNEQAELTARLTRAENAYLQQQLNPHLLFNSLNFIYSRVAEHSEQASSCVLLLSDILRYTLEPSGDDGKKQLADELIEVNNLININRFRFAQGLCLNCHISEAAGSWRIIPLILLTLTENIFKHGQLLDPENPGSITIAVNDQGKLHYHSANLKKRVTFKTGTPDTGIGMQNVRIRLDQYYPGRYQMVINEDPQSYHVNLTIEL